MTPLDRLNEAVNAIISRAAIKNKGDLATYLDYSFSYLSTVLNGKEKITPLFLEKLSQKLDVNPKYILDGEEPMFAAPVSGQHNINGDNLTSGAVKNTENSAPVFMEVLAALQEQLAVKDKQIERLLDLLNGTK